MLYVKTVATLMHDTFTGSVPPIIAKLLTRSRDIHSYNARFSNAGNFYVNNWVIT